MRITLEKSKVRTLLNQIGVSLLILLLMVAFTLRISMFILISENQVKLRNWRIKLRKLQKEKGYKKLFRSVVPQILGSTESLRVLLAYGFKLDSSAVNLIVFVKEI